MHQTYRNTIVLIGACMIFGCGQRNHVTDIRGTIQMDGTPLRNVFVSLWPKDDPSLGDYNGMTDGEGNFDIAIDPMTCPARPGMFAVVLRAPSPPPVSQEKLEQIKNRLPDRSPPISYTQAGTSPITVELANGANDLGRLKIENPG